MGCWGLFKQYVCCWGGSLETIYESCETIYKCVSLLSTDVLVIQLCDTHRPKALNSELCGLGTGQTGAGPNTRHILEEPKDALATDLHDFQSWLFLKNLPETHRLGE